VHPGGTIDEDSIGHARKLTARQYEMSFAAVFDPISLIAFTLRGEAREHNARVTAIGHSA
jgi:hypothetical protein